MHMEGVILPVKYIVSLKCIYVHFVHKSVKFFSYVDFQVRINEQAGSPLGQ